MTPAERLMAYSEVAKVINESNIGRAAGMMGMVCGIHDENTMVIATPTHEFEFNVVRVTQTS